MKLALRKFFGLALLAGSLALHAAAQPGPHGGFHRQERAYVQANVVPVLRQQRQKLEQELAPADRTQLAAYRTQLKELSQRGRALHQAARARPRPAAPDSATRRWGRPAPSPEQQAAHSERREIMRQVTQLAQKYQPTIARIAAELKPQQTQWAADLHAIRQKSQLAERVTPGPGGDAAATLGRSVPRLGHGSSWVYRLPRPAAFLLLDPGTAASVGKENVATSLYPNPVASVSQLQYEVKQAGPVKIEVLDKNGTTLRTLLQAASQLARTRQPLT